MVAVGISLIEVGRLMFGKAGLGVGVCLAICEIGSGGVEKSLVLPLGVQDVKTRKMDKNRKVAFSFFMTDSKIEITNVEFHQYVIDRYELAKSIPAEQLWTL